MIFRLDLFLVAEISIVISIISLDRELGNFEIVIYYVICNHVHKNQAFHNKRDTWFLIFPTPLYPILTYIITINRKTHFFCPPLFLHNSHCTVYLPTVTKFMKWHVPLAYSLPKALANDSIFHSISCSTTKSIKKVESFGQDLMQSTYTFFFYKRAFLTQFWNFLNFLTIPVSKVSYDFLCKNFWVPLFCAHATLTSCMYTWNDDKSE